MDILTRKVPYLMHRRKIVDGSIEKIFKANETKRYAVFSCSNGLIVQ